MDESGHEDWIVVAGVLFREEETHAFNEGLRSALSAISPLSPWPLHATDLRRAVTRLVWAAGLDKDGITHTAGAARMVRLCRPLLGEIAGAARVNPPGWLASWQKALEGRGMPPHGDLIAAEGWLRARRPGPMAALEGAVREELAQLRALLDGLRDRAQVIAAAGRITGEAAGEIRGLRQDDYVRTLGAMFERVIASTGGDRPQRLWCRVATRNVQQRGVHRMELRHWQVGYVVEAARTGLTGCGGLRVLPMSGIERYDGQAVPGLVLADIAANALRPPITRGGSLGVLRQRLREEAIGGWDLSVAVDRLGGARLPALAAEGEAQRLIRHRQPPPPDLRPTWIADQAAAWVRAEEAV